MLTLILLVLALVSFCLGAAGVQARVSFDQLGKAFLVDALIVSQYAGHL